MDNICCGMQLFMTSNKDMTVMGLGMIRIGTGRLGRMMTRMRRLRKGDD
jgi:imidazoleglycerol phosphate synthase glutamine amidotransferase subunit HisH